MAPAANEPAPPPGGDEEDEAPITLLYVRPSGPGTTELDARLQEIARRYAPTVELVTVTDLPTRGATSPPTVVVLRRGEVVCEAMGALLPRRELDRAVRRALAIDAAT